jgi:hypothetical protein
MRVRRKSNIRRVVLSHVKAALFAPGPKFL